MKPQNCLSEVPSTPKVPPSRVILMMIEMTKSMTNANRLFFLTFFTELKLSPRFLLMEIYASRLHCLVGLFWAGGLETPHRHVYQSSVKSFVNV